MSDSIQSTPASGSAGDSSKRLPVVPGHLLLSFVMVTSLFALWGFANDVTNPLVKAFQEVFLISNQQSSLVQTAFYGGYATMAIPAAIFIRRFSYKAGIIVGLALYAAGALAFIPASILMNFWLFLVALYVLTFGLAFLETTANPYILSMGPPETATRRLNFAQAFNPVGSLIGIFVITTVVLPNLSVSEFRAEQMADNPAYVGMLPGEIDASIMAALKEVQETAPAEYREMRTHDLQVVRLPYVAIGVIVLAVMAAFLLIRMPKTEEANGRIDFLPTVRRLARNGHYVGGVIAQTFYVGAQIMCWTFIIHYGMATLGMSSAEASSYNLITMSIFMGSRFICTYMLKYIDPGKLLMILAAGAIALLLGAIFLEGYPGLYSLVGVSACMSLMFPTIYGIALEGLGDDAKIASAGLIFAIVGGALMPPLQGSIIDLGTVGPLAAVRASFFLPLFCFVVVAAFGFYAHRTERTVATHP